MTLNPIWKTDSKLTGIASRRIFAVSPCGLTSCSEEFEDGDNRVDMAKEGFLIECPILGAAGLQFIRRIPLTWTSDRRRLAQGYSRFRHQDLIAIEPILKHLLVSLNRGLKSREKRTALHSEVPSSILSES
jgi:hypothetical protein